MRISDWSSDVCSSDLQTTPVAVSAVDSSLINQAAPRDIGDLATFVPNFSAAKITGFNAASFALRGVSVNNIIVYYRSEEHTSELQSLMRISSAVFCFKKHKILPITQQIQIHVKSIH